MIKTEKELKIESRDEVRHFPHDLKPENLPAPSKLHVV